MTLPFCYRKQLIIGLFCLVLLLIGGGSILYFKSNPSSKETTTKSLVLASNDNSIKEENSQKKIINKIKVDIKGYINTPGLYEIEEGKRIQDIITLAGGLQEGADTSTINLGKKVTDEMVIIIYSKEEINNYIETKTKEKEKLEACCCQTEIRNDACITAPKEEISDKKISLNTASKEELMTLPGIGESKADDIISYRNTNGNFEKIEDIMNIAGIKESIFEKIKSYLTL